MKQLILITVLFLSINAFAQDDKTVTLVVSGQGKTIEEAKQNALRSAIEQAFGAFISSKTEILNDELLQEQIISISNGNIKKFEVLSSLFLNDQNLHLISINATVSIDKLATFIRNNGFDDVSFDGGGFAMNLKVQKLNASSEIVALQNLLVQGLTICDGMFDRELQVGNPYLESNNRANILPMYVVPLTVNTKLNSNWYTYYDYFKKTLKNISMSREEVETYKDLKKDVYHLVLLGMRDKEKKYSYSKDGVEYRMEIRNGGDYESIDTLTFRTADALINLYSFYILLNAKYLDGVRIVHDLDTLDLDINYESKYRIATRRDYHDRNLWKFKEMPFELITSYQSKTVSEVHFKPIIIRGKYVRTEEAGRVWYEAFDYPLDGLQNYIKIFLHTQTITAIGFLLMMQMMNFGCHLFRQ